MTEKFKEIYRIESSRLKGWDYSTPGKYFVTICTGNREEFFGEILDNKMILSDIGKIANELWYKIPNRHPMAKLNEFIVMPNHIHGIIQIIENDNELHPVETPRGASLPSQNHQSSKNPHHNWQWKPGSLGVIVNQYKGDITKMARRINPDFAWQSRFNDHIIRNNKSLSNIQEYIRTNPKNWKTDRHNNN